jgi:hypothetical protein
MKITGFNPLICSRHAEDVVRLFEALGFETTHTKENLNGENIHEYRMKDVNGHHVDVSSAGDRMPMPNDLTVIRINVDDFDEGMKFFSDRGFFNPLGDRTLDGGTSKDAILLSQSGFGIRLIQHIKEETNI